MLGIGTGFDTKGAGMCKVFKPIGYDERLIEIEDSREGWVDSVKILLDSFFIPNSMIPKFSYSLIRAAGVPLKTFGGLSSGPDPLIELHEGL
jgi:ribonucleoside-triphosphate reductase (thioredoxin)